MSGYVWRLVVDKWPTENGLPFDCQGYSFWDEVVSQYKAGGEVPAWLPAELEPWLSTGDSIAPEKDGAIIGYDDPPDFTTGYPGDGDYLMNVPATPTRKFLARSSVAARLNDLRAWGCVARIERAPIGDWEEA